MYRHNGFLLKQLLHTLLCVLILSGCAKYEEEAPTIFYPKPPEQPRLQFLTSISSGEDLEAKRSAFDDFLLGPDLSFTDIGRPYDVSSSPGKIYILDRQYNKILIADLVTNSFSALNDSRLGVLRSPAGIWVTEDDVKYVADMERQQVVVFDADNNFVRAYGDKELFAKPVDVAVHENKIYVCDMLKHQIIVLDKDSGKMLTTVGKIGADEGQLYKPTHITIDNLGNIFVNDAFNFRVQQFDSNGKFVKIFGFHGDQIGAMARSKGLDTDREGHLYVADAAFENVQIFNDKGQLLLFFGGPGISPGNMYLPAGIHIDYDNVEFFNKFADKDFKLKYLLYVCNMSGPYKLNVYGFGDWIGK